MDLRWADFCKVTLAALAEEEGAFDAAARHLLVDAACRDLGALRSDSCGAPSIEASPSLPTLAGRGDALALASNAWAAGAEHGLLGPVCVSFEGCAAANSAAAFWAPEAAAKCGPAYLPRAAFGGGASSPASKALLPPADEGADAGAAFTEAPKTRPVVCECKSVAALCVCFRPGASATAARGLVSTAHCGGAFVVAPRGPPSTGGRKQAALLRASFSGTVVAETPETLLRADGEGTAGISGSGSASAGDGESAQITTRSGDGAFTNLPSTGAVGLLGDEVPAGEQGEAERLGEP